MKIKKIVQFSVSFFVISFLVFHTSIGKTSAQNYVKRPVAGSFQDAVAVWGTNGIEINNSIGNTPQINPKMIGPYQGFYFMVWEDNRNGYSNIYAQKIDEAGAKYWGSEGVQLCTAKGNQNFPSLTEDGAGGIIVVWQDYRHGNTDIFSQRIGSQGNLLWERNGAPISTAAAGQFAPEIISDLAGGAIIVWHDYRSGTGEDIFSQRINKDGENYWQQNGIPVCDAPGTQWYPKISPDNSGGAIIAWTDGRGGSSNNDIYGQRIDQAGRLLWQKNGIAICQNSRNQEHPNILSVDDGAIIVWDDSRGGAPNIYSQKINFEGTPFWIKDGIAATAASNSQQGAKLAPDGSGGAVLVWADGRQEESIVFTQRLSSGGNLMWGDNGRSFGKGAARQENPSVVKLKGSEWGIIWEDYSEGESNIYGQKINSSGIPIWQEGGRPLAPSAKSQEKGSIAATPGGNLLAVWQDKRFGNYDIYCQNIASSGTLLFGNTGLLVCSAAGAVLHQNISVVPSDSQSVILSFEDARSGYKNIYLQKVSKDGTSLWGRNGIALAKIKEEQANAQLCADDEGGVFVVWEDGRNNGISKVFSQKINAAGKKLWPKAGVPMTAITCRQSAPLIKPDHAGGLFVFWQDERDTLSQKDLYGQRLSKNGEILWDKNGTKVCGENGDQTEAAICTDKENGLIISWCDYRRGERNPDIYAQRINESGKLLWKNDGVIVCGAPDIQRTPQNISDGQGGAIFVWTDKGAGSYDIYAQRLNQDGKTMWLTDGIAINQSPRTQQRPTLCRSGKEFSVIWEDYRYGNWDIFINKFSIDGKLIWKEEGIPLVA
ncbi:MAG: hypothetical protein WCV91_01175, partial [Candidatus Margulisiibacteriota bacterium]